MDDYLFTTIITLALANGVIACAGAVGLGLIVFLGVRTRNPGVLFAGLGFLLLACAHLGFAGQWFGFLIGIDADSTGQTTLNFLATANSAFSVAAAVAVVSLILGFWYTYRRFFPSLREVTGEGEGRGFL